MSFLFCLNKLYDESVTVSITTFLKSEKCDSNCHILAVSFCEMQVAHWMKNGISYEDARQLVSDIKEDSFCCDPDIGVAYGSTIDERIRSYDGMIE